MTDLVHNGDDNSRPRIPITCQMCQSVLGVDDYSGTVVRLAADDPGWLAESFRPAVVKFFRHWSDVRIQSLTFNGETVFDFRDWWQPPAEAIAELKPITVEVRQPNIPEWKEPKGA